MGAPFFKDLRRAYGFDEVAIVPGQVTVNPDMTSTQMTIGQHVLDIPILASSMDAVVSPSFASLMHRKGGLGVLNLEGVYTRYPDPYVVLEEIASAPLREVTSLLQRVYSEPIREEMVGACVESIKKSGATCAVAVTPQNTKWLSSMAVEAGADVLVVQSTVTTARHISRSYRGLIFSELIENIDVPVVVGNCVGYSTALELMETGISGLLVGVGPGAALHHPRGGWRRRTPGDGHDGLRCGPGGILQQDG